MASEADLLRLALSVHEAVFDPELWLAFLKRYAEATAADAAFLQIHDLASHASVILSSFGLSSPLKQSYNEHYSKINVWREWGGTSDVPGRVNLDQELCPRPVLERSEFYNDCLKFSGIVYSMGAVIAREGARALTLSCLRSLPRHPFDEAEREIARFILPHLNRAWTIARRLELLAAGQSVLDTLPFGVVFLAPGGAAIYSNRAAEEILGSHDGLCLRNGRLTALYSGAEAHLREANDGALSPCKLPGPAAISVPRPSLRRDFQVVAAPLRGWFRQLPAMSRPIALVLITDPERPQPVSTHLLMHLYRLTRKEAALAEKLSEGKSVDRAAEELSVT